LIGWLCFVWQTFVLYSALAIRPRVHLVGYHLAPSLMTLGGVIHSF